MEREIAAVQFKGKVVSLTATYDDEDRPTEFRVLHRGVVLNKASTGDLTDLGFAPEDVELLMGVAKLSAPRREGA